MPLSRSQPIQSKKKKTIMTWFARVFRSRTWHVSVLLALIVTGSLRCLRPFEWSERSLSFGYNRLLPFSSTTPRDQYIPKSKKVAAIDWRLVYGVWPFITRGAFWGETIAWWRCVRRSSWIAAYLRHTPRIYVGALLGLCGTSGYQQKRLHLILASPRGLRSTVHVKTPR